MVGTYWHLYANMSFFISFAPFFFLRVQIRHELLASSIVEPRVGLALRREGFAYQLDA